MVRQSVSKHLAVLEAANLVTTVRRGREKLHYLNAAPINDIGERMITRRARARAGARRPEARARGGHHRGQTTFVYTTYIRTTPDSRSTPGSASRRKRNPRASSSTPVRRVAPPDVRTVAQASGMISNSDGRRPRAARTVRARRPRAPISVVTGTPPASRSRRAPALPRRRSDRPSRPR
jgi:hypothetical protein